MNFVSVGDLSRIFTLRGANAGLRSDIERLSKEVTTGLRSDISRHLDGDLVEFAKIEYGLTQAQSFRQVAAEAASTAASMQVSLAVLQDFAEASGATMLSDTSLAVSSSLVSVATAAKSQLSGAIAALNTNVGGRFVFSGTKVDRPAVVSAEDLIAQAQGIITGSADADEAVSRLRDWFDAAPGTGGFADSAYQGATGPVAEFGIDPSTAIRFEQTSNDQGIRDILLGLTLGAVVAEGAFAGDHMARSRMMRAGGAVLIEGNGAVALSRADLGMTEQMIERSATRMESMLTSLTIERTNLVQADTYEAGSHLVQAEAQLEALFAMTARLSNLSLAKYL